MYGAYELLNRLGVRFYSKDCEVVPKIADLTIPGLVSSIKPHYDMRAIFKLDVYFHGLGRVLNLDILHMMIWVTLAIWERRRRGTGSIQPVFLCIPHLW